jgi:hypothetical protein
MALYSAESNRGWVAFRDGEWEECDVVNSNQQQISLRLASGEQRTVNRNQCQFHYRNPSAVEAADDFLTLPNLDEPNILHSLRVRYWKGIVYSYTGPILIAVNPWRAVDIYNINMLEGFKAGKLKSPHIFGVATKAFKELMANRKNQCILISGESGAGKTESTKYVLQVLTVAGDIRTGASASIEQQVMLTNPGACTSCICTPCACVASLAVVLQEQSSARASNRTRRALVTTSCSRYCPCMACAATAMCVQRFRSSALARRHVRGHCALPIFLFRRKACQPPLLIRPPAFACSCHAPPPGAAAVRCWQCWRRSEMPRPCATTTRRVSASGSTSTLTARAPSQVGSSRVSPI